MILTSLRAHSRIIVGAIAVGVISAAMVPRWIAARQIEPPNREQKMSTRFDTYRTTCFGRYLIDVPVAAEISLGKSTSDSNNVARIPDIASDGALESMADAREQQLKSSPHATEQMLFKSKSRSSSGRSRVIVSRPGKDEVELFLVEAIARVDKAAWRVSYTTGADFLNVTIKQVGDIADSLKYRAESDIPKGPGACIKDGLLMRTPMEVEEFSGGAKVPPLSWSLEYQTEISGLPNKGDSLWERSDRAISMAGPESGIKKLRRTPVGVNGLAGQQYVALYPTKDGTIFDAKAELYGDGTPKRATVKLHMEASQPIVSSGSGHPQSLTTDESLAIWDAVIRSVRPRPAAF